MMRRMLLFLLTASCCCVSIADATNNYNFGGDNTGSPGDSVTIVVEGETDVEIKGYSIIFVYNADVFEYATSTLEGTRGQGAAFFTPGSSDTTAVAGVIYSFSCPPSISPGMGPLLMVTLVIRPEAPAGVTYLDLRDVSPSLNRLTPCSGATISPTLTDGTFEVLGADPGCSVTPTELDFGEVGVGTFADLPFTVRNTGGGMLTGAVSANCDGFSIVSGEGPYALGAAESLEVIVRFEPPAYGVYACAIETGSELCTDVACGGATPGTAVGQRVGGWTTQITHLLPNPSPGPVTIRFSLDASCPARIAVHDLGGRLVRMLASGPFPAGQQSFVWDGRSDTGLPLPAGVYYVRLATPRESTAKRVITLE